MCSQFEHNLTWNIFHHHLIQNLSQKYLRIVLKDLPQKNCHLQRAKYYFSSEMEVEKLRLWSCSGMENHTHCMLTFTTIEFHNWIFHHELPKYHNCLLILQRYKWNLYKKLELALISQHWDLPIYTILELSYYKPTLFLSNQYP